MQFPSEFEWLSPDGNGLLTSYMPDHYSAGWQLDLATTLEEAIERGYNLFCDLAAVSATKATMLPVGTDYTPPNRWVTQLAREWSERYVWPRFVAGLPKEFFAAVRAELAEAGRVPSPQTREMGPIYTGKDVSFIDTKQANRLAEAALIEAEKLAAFALALGDDYPERAADKAWRQLVFNSHHDGITGSESDQVYLDLLGGWREAYELAGSARNSALEVIASRIDTGNDGPKLVVFNSLAYERSDLVEAVISLPERGARSVVVRDTGGNEVPATHQPHRLPPGRDLVGSKGTVRGQGGAGPGLPFLSTWNAAASRRRTGCRLTGCRPPTNGSWSRPTRLVAVALAASSTAGPGRMS